MYSKEKSNNNQVFVANNTPLDFGAKVSAPLIFAAVFLLTLAYMADFLLAGKAEAGIGEISHFSQLLYDCSNLLSKLIFPLISGGIALTLEGGSALASGLMGGMLASLGATFTSANANATSTSGIFGCILAGFAAGYSVRILKRTLAKPDNFNENLAFFIIPLLSLFVTLSIVLMVNTFSDYLSNIAVKLAGFCSNKNGLLLSVLLGIFMTADFGGPLYLAGYTFGVATLSTGEERYMAAVIAAGAIAPITMGLYSIIHKEHNEKHEQILGAAGLVGGLLGIPHTALIFYTKKTYRFVLACIPGGIISAVLSYSFNCSSELPAGGILGIISSGKPLFYIPALCCGGLISTFLLSLAENKKYIDAENKTQNSNNNKRFSVQT